MTDETIVIEIPPWLCLDKQQTLNFGKMLRILLFRIAVGD